MEYRCLGPGGPSVSRLCFGSLTVGPTQARLPEKRAQAVLLHAFSQGINFIDTAETYENYPLLRRAMREHAGRVHLSTKTYAYTRNMAAASLERARKALDRDFIDIFLLHEQESCLTLDGHREAFAYLLEQKEKGVIGSIGISTHAVEPVQALAQAKSDAGIWQRLGLDPGPYRHADIIHPLINRRGIGILDQGLEAMLAACKAAHAVGLGLYGMKVLGGGHLLEDYDEALRFALGLDFLDSIAIGMQDETEVDMNAAVFSGRPVEAAWIEAAKAKKRRLLIEDWCHGCGRCVERCGEKALRLENGRAVVEPDRCVFCGYCATACRDFAIKVV